MKNKNTKMVNISIRSLIFIIIFVSSLTVTFTSVIPYLLSLIDNKSDDRINAILSIISNISGGLIAGIIAYITAKYQIFKIEKQEKDKGLRLALTELKFLKQELKYNFKILKNISPEDSPEQIVEHLSQHLRIQTWTNTNLNFVNYINDDLLDALFKYYDQVNFIINNKVVRNIQSLVNSNQEIKEQLNNEINNIK